MKKLISLFLCFGLIFFAVSCKKNLTTEEIEQKISKELQENKQFDAHVKAEIYGDIEGVGEKKIFLDADIKADTTGNFPIVYYSGDFGIEGMMTIPATFYVDESGMIISAMGMTEKEDLSDKDKEEIKKIVEKSKSSNKVNVEKTVKKTKVDGKDAIEITYNADQINDSIKELNEDAANDIKVDKFVSCYVLKNRDELDYMTANYVMVLDDQPFNCDFTITYNSFGEPLEITPPSVDDSNKSNSGFNLF